MSLGSVTRLNRQQHTNGRRYCASTRATRTLRASSSGSRSWRNRRVLSSGKPSEASSSLSLETPRPHVRQLLPSLPPSPSPLPSFFLLPPLSSRLPSPLPSLPAPLRLHCQHLRRLPPSFSSGSLPSLHPCRASFPSLHSAPLHNAPLHLHHTTGEAMAEAAAPNPELSKLPPGAVVTNFDGGEGEPMVDGGGRPRARVKKGAWVRALGACSLAEGSRVAWA